MTSQYLIPRVCIVESRGIVGTHRREGKGHNPNYEISVSGRGVADLSLNYTARIHTYSMYCTTRQYIWGHEKQVIFNAL